MVAPEVLDQSERGTLSGKRLDSVTYVCQRPGKFLIPATRLSWFDLRTQQLQVIDLPARTVTAEPSPSVAAAKPLSSVAGDWRKALMVAAVIAFVVMVIALGRKVPFARIWHYAVAPFRPVHLQPLNPNPTSDS